MGTAGREVTPCPGCQKPARLGAVAVDARPDPFPFCSFRCQMIDLGRWIDEEYRIPDADDQSGGGASESPGADEET